MPTDNINDLLGVLEEEPCYPRCVRSQASKVGCVALLSLASTFACANKPSTNVALADGDHHKPTAPRGAAVEHEADAGLRPHIERMHIELSVSGLGDMLDAGERVYAQWVAPEPGTPALDFQTYMDLALVQFGFGPAWFANVDLDGFHTVEFRTPHEDQIGLTMADYHAAATIASRNPAALIQGLPPEPRPEQLEANLWQVHGDEDLRVLLRTRADVLEVATSFELLDSLAATRKALQPGPKDPRVRLSLSNLDEDVFDLREMLEAQRIEPAKQQAIIDAARLELRADFGSDRDLMAHMGIVAPLGQVGGPALTDTSALAQILPSGAWLVMVQSWALPASFVYLRAHTHELPPALVPLVDQLLTHGDDLLAQVGNENVSAVYVDRKGRATLVFLTSVADEQAAKTATRELFASVEKAWLGSPGRARVDHEAFRAGKLQPDLLTVEFPSTVRYTLDGMPWLLGTGLTPTLEISSTVAAGKLVIAAGPGQRELLETVAGRLSGANDDGLERGGGLARARELTGGCQTCVAIDPIAIADGLLAILAAHPDADRAFRKLLDTTRKRLLGLGLSGELSFAGHFGAQRWDFAASVPQALLLLGPDVAPRVVESLAAVREGYDRIATAKGEELCEHVMDVLEREMGQSSTITADERAKFLASCVKEMEKEREKIGDDTFRKQAKCVMQADALEEMAKCENL